MLPGRPSVPSERKRHRDAFLVMVLPPASRDVAGCVPNIAGHTGGMADPRTLQALVDEGRVDELLNLVPVEAVTETWLRYHRLEQHPADSDDDPDWWTVELWMSPAWWSEEQRVREGLLRLIEAADGDALSFVAAGPLEVFIADDASRLDWIEQQARRSEKFRRALAQVWVWELPTDAFARVERAAGVRLARPDH